MENVALKIQVLEPTEDDMQTLPKFLGSLVDSVVTLEELKERVAYLKSKGIILRPVSYKVAANDLVYLKKMVEGMEKLGEIQAYIDDPNRINDKQAVARLAYLIAKGAEYKNADGKYAKVVFLDKEFAAQYGVVDFAAEAAKKVAAVKAEAPAQSSVKKDVAPAPGPKVETKSEEVKKEVKPAEPVTKATPVKPETVKSDAKKEDKPVEAKVSPEKTEEKAPVVVETKKTEAPVAKASAEQAPKKVEEPVKKDVKVAPVVKPAEPAKVDVKKEATAPVVEAPKKPQVEDKTKKIEKSVETPKVEKKPEDKPVEPKKAEEVKSSDGKKTSEADKKEQTVAQLVASDEVIDTSFEDEFKAELDDAIDFSDLEAAFNDVESRIEDTKKAKEEKTVKVVNSEVPTEADLMAAELVGEDEFASPYDEMFSKPLTLGFNDESFERFERLTETVRRVLVDVYGSAEINNTISENLSRLVIYGVPDDSEVIYVAITYGKEISEAEHHLLKSKIQETLDYTGILDIDFRRAA